jgi:hypothetical protein
MDGMMWTMRWIFLQTLIPEMTIVEEHTTIPKMFGCVGIRNKSDGLLGELTGMCLDGPAQVRMIICIA